MQTLDAKCLLNALTRAIKFQEKQRSGIDCIIALTEVRDAVRYAINPKPRARKKAKRK